MDATDEGALRLAVRGAVATLVGIVLSGPLAVALVAATHPQPGWDGPRLFARSFHPIAGTAFTIGAPGWVMTTAGLIAFALWNLLLAAMATLASTLRGTPSPTTSCPA